MPFPDTTLGSDTLDPEYGGLPANKIDGRSWRWLNAVLRFLSRAYLAYLRVAYTTVAAVSQTSALPGDVAVFVGGNFVVGSAYDVRKYVAGLTGARFAGVYLEGCNPAARARVITSGIVPALVAGIGAQAAVKAAGLDVATGRLRVAVVGDVVLGTIDLQGNVLLTGYGTTAP
jgi:hypothetical protein